MSEPKSLHLRLQLINKFEQLAARLADHDDNALEEAADCLVGISLAASDDTMELICRALSKVLEDFQGEIDSNGWKYVLLPIKPPK